MQKSGLFDFPLAATVVSFMVETTGVVTITSSFQMAKFESPVVKIMSFRKGERCTVFTNQ